MPLFPERVLWRGNVWTTLLGGYGVYFRLIGAAARGSPAPAASHGWPNTGLAWGLDLMGYPGSPVVGRPGARIGAACHGWSVPILGSLHPLLLTFSSWYWGEEKDGKRGKGLDMKMVALCVVVYGKE
jgi:hypothetical protein